ncbi:monocarboxylate transporter 13-like, partial [Saccoglossus kowalevskii]|uniref:Monocarboxylate transporter 12-B-like n=1 Tax=Saccoglossus kowalevskii TaxID=10224 RepID=A0ABM0MKS2_SACKO
IGNKMAHTNVEPPDGGYGWIILLASVGVQSICAGSFNVSGIFLVSYVEYFQKGAAQASIIASITGALYTSSGLLADYLHRKLGARLTVMIGGFLSTFGIVLSIFSPSLTFLYFSYGIIVGIGYGVSVITVLITISLYFKRRYAFANGIAFVGSAAGTMCLPPLYNYIIEQYGWRGALFIVAGIHAQIIVFGALLRPLKTRRPIEEIKMHDKQLDNGEAELALIVYQNSENQDLRLHVVNRNEITCSDFNEEKPVTQDRKINDYQEIRDENGTANSSPSQTHRILNYLGMGLFIEIPSFSLLVFAQFLEGVGSITAILYVVSNAVTIGISKANSAFLLTLFGCGNIVGRLAPGWLVDHGYIAPLTLTGITIGGSGFIILCIPFTKLYVIIAVLICFYGFLFGIYQPIMIVALRDFVGEANHSKAIAWDWFGMSIGFLCGTPFTGWLYDMTGNYNASFFFAGCALILSGAIILLTPTIRICLSKKE